MSNEDKIYIDVRGIQYKFTSCPNCKNKVKITPIPLHNPEINIINKHESLQKLICSSCISMGSVSTKLVGVFDAPMGWEQYNEPPSWLLLKYANEK